MARDLGCEYENWAVGGGGNQQIARRILYRDQQFGWQPDDMVVVQWTSITREDRYLEHGWVNQGSVSMAPYYGAKWVDRYWSWNNDVINTAQARITSELVLKDRLKYQMAMTWGDGDDLHLLANDSKITDFWRSKLTDCDELPAQAQPFNGRTRDGHPDPRWWLNWVETKIYPKLGYTIKPETRKQVMEMQQYLETLVSQGVSQQQLQHLGTIHANKTGWPMFRKVKPFSDTLTPGQGSNVLM